MEKDTLIKITNRGYGIVVYSIEDLGIRREYQPNETKEVTFEEIQKLSYTTGGRVLLEQNLIIEDSEAVEALLGTVEPEYYYNMEDIKSLLENGTLDQLDDCLTFGGEGVQEMVKRAAVDIELNDMRKRSLILQKTGYDVNNAIMIKQMEEEPEQEEATSGRKAAVFEKSESAAPQRKASKYKVTSSLNK